MIIPRLKFSLRFLMSRLILQRPTVPTPARLPIDSMMVTPPNPSNVPDLLAFPLDALSYCRGFIDPGHVGYCGR